MAWLAVRSGRLRSNSGQAEARVSSAEEQQRWSVLGCRGRDHLGEEDAVIPDILLGDDPALQISNRAIDERTMRDSLVVRDLGQFIVWIRRQPPGKVIGDISLTLAEYIDREDASPRQKLVRPRVLVDADEYDWGHETYRGEGVDGDTACLLAKPAGNDSHAGCEVAEDTAELERIDRHPSLCLLSGGSPKVGKSEFGRARFAAA